MPTRLSRAALDQARQFVGAKGRLLDAVLIAHALGEGSTDDVLAALASYQNEDGGFGHALEPDLRTPASTGIATTIGLQMLRRVAAPADHPIVQGVVGYLLETVDRAAGVWPIVGPAVDEAPHAPWWEHSTGLGQAWNGFRFNPTAELLGGLLDYRTLVPADLLDELQAKMLASIEATDKLDGTYDLTAAWRLRLSADLPAPLADALDRMLSATLADIAPHDPHISYLELAPPGTGPLGALVEQRFELALDTAIMDQQPDGNWRPFWSWQETSAAGWYAAEADWNSALTRRTIEVLAAYDRIER